MKYFIRSLALCGFILTSALATASFATTPSPFVGYIGKYEVVQSNFDPCDMPGCYFHIHLGDKLEIKSTDIEAKVLADEMKLSVNMTEGYEDLGDGYSYKASFVSKNGSAEWYSGTNVGGDSLILKMRRDGLYSYHYESSRGQFTTYDLKLVLKKLD